MPAPGQRTISRWQEAQSNPDEEAVVPQRDFGRLAFALVLLSGVGGCTNDAGSGAGSSEPRTTGTSPLTTKDSKKEAPVFTQAQEQAAEALRRVGGRIIVERKASGQPILAVNLSRGTATDADLEQLRALPHVAYLYLEDAYLTDAGLTVVGELRQLQTLDLRFTSIGDAGLAHLGRLQQLRSLNLTNTKVTDVGLAHLKQLPQLERLRLGFTAVTDSGLKHLTPLARLQELDLSATQVTDAGLEHFVKLTQLQELTLSGAKVTPAGLTRLTKDLPKTRIIR
jgi:Leucine-rich repeat (LRR) protein